MKNPYQNLLNTIPVPEELEDRVLSAAKRQTAPVGKPSRRRGRRMLQAAVCGACALTLVLGTLTLRKPEAAGGSPAQRDQGGALVLAPSLSFGLTAYAAETGETYAPNANSGIAFSAGYGMVNPGEGDYTGCVFQITGEGIETVSLSIDRGGLYRYRLHENLTEEQTEPFRQAMEEGRIATTTIDQADGGAWYVPELTALGQNAREDYDPSASYGFWVPPEDMAYGTGMGIVPEAEMDIDYFNGAVLTVGVTFTDGSEQAKTYRLSSGCLRVSWGVDGTLDLLPQLAGDNEAYVYGLYAAELEASRWLQWPVKDSSTVSMSYPFGTWNRTLVNENEDGETEIIEKTIVHNGIDIPALRGTPVTAAEGGTVAETGFDTERGNYVVLDHGGGLRTVYASCGQITVTEGGAVTAGQEIALAGSTGLSTGPHLCFQVWQDGQPQNPVAYFDSAVRATLSVG